MQTLEHGVTNECFKPTPPEDFYVVKIGQEALWALQGERVIKNRTKVETIPYSFEEADANIVLYSERILGTQSEELEQIVKKIKEGDATYINYHNLADWGVQVRDNTMLNNFGLVAKTANRYRKHDFDYEDLVQEGLIGLVRAVELYDPGNSTQFSTFATRAIERRIERYVARMRYPATIEPNAFRRYRQFGPEDENPTEVANAYYRIKRILNMFSLDSEDQDLDKRINHERFSIYPDPTAEEAIRRVELERREKYSEVVKLQLQMMLTPREYQVAMLRAAGFTLKEIGERYGLKKQRISQIASETFGKIRELNDAGLLSI